VAMCTVLLGCPVTNSAAEVVCVTDEDCLAGEVCAAVRRDYRVCIPACDPASQNLCADGAVCDLAGCLPGSLDPREACAWSRQCAFGHSCSWALDGELGRCVPACGHDSDCPLGQACFHATCVAICDARLTGSCPPGYGCTFFGSCLPRDCAPWGDNPDEPNGCAPDATCQGSDPGGHCLRAPSEEELGLCGPDAQLGPTYRCYARSELRPVR
jgi:hypothetical protein